MNVEEIKKKIEFAIEAVKNIHDADYKLEAFKIILQHSLLENAVPISSDTTPTQQGKSSLIPENIEKNLNVLADESKLSREELDNLLSIKDGKLQIHYTFNKTDRENMIDFAQCYLIAMFFIFKKEWVRSEEIVTAMRANGIEDKSNNFSANLKSKSDVFVKRGKGRELEFKLVTPQGRKTALELVHNLVK